jgi:hypothetical protein
MKHARYALPAAAAMIVALSAGAIAQQKPTPPQYLGNFDATHQWGFNPKLSPPLPGDAYVPDKDALEAKKQFQLVQRLFDLWSWQAFLAVNWPTSSSGQPAGSITDYSKTAMPAWERWHESNQIYLPKGATPPACGLKLTAAAHPSPRALAVLARAGVPPPPPAAAASGVRVMFNVSAVGELVQGHALKGPAPGHGISEIDQAFSGPLYDKNGLPTYYEILMDSNEVGYLCRNKLYSIAGQLAFSSAGKTVQFPSGDYTQNASGAFELKLAWRILDPKTDAIDRFYHQPAYVFLENAWVLRDIGLVGLHIAHKSKTSPQWIWSTFEQVDNLQTDSVDHPKLTPSYYNPGCATCLVNTQPGANTATPGQVQRVIPIPLDKQALNKEAAAALRAQKSVWQYYQLIDTQWPTQPNAKPTTPGDANLPNSIDNKSGGFPTPVYLTNMTMETYFQDGNQLASNQQEGNPPGKARVFGTESCMGCHSSAGVADGGTPAKPTYGGQLTADFSWLLSQKAQ